MARKTHIGGKYDVTQRKETIDEPVDLDDAPLTAEELSNLRPAKEILPEAFFKTLQHERELRNRRREAADVALKRDSLIKKL